MCFLCLVVCVACPPPVSSPEYCVGFLPGFTPLSQDSVQQMMIKESTPAGGCPDVDGQRFPGKVR
jgi:hypothetical protein